MANRTWPPIPVLFSLLVALVGLLTPRAALAGPLDLERPGQRQFVADHAEILDAEAEREIRRVATKLLDEHATPIVVVTIESMAAHGGAGMSIESFAHTLFDQWGVGHPTLESDWNTGILVVIAKQDRKARIELGAGWRHSKDAEARRIMSELIVPAFKQGDYSGGTLRGVEALAAMARTKPLPEPRRRSWDWLFNYDLPDWLIDLVLIAALVLLAIGIVVSLIKSGTQGWGWMVLAGVFSLLWALLVRILIERLLGFGRTGKCGPRGSFGGGSSGGGGASGEW